MDFLSDLNRKLDEYLSPAVKTILLINVFVFLAINILDSFKPGFAGLFTIYFGQTPALLRYMPPFLWTILTYAFVHVDGLHILFNMVTLWFFGPPLENRWGTRYFWMFYLGTAMGAGLINGLFTLGGYFAHTTMFGNPYSPVIGASGALNAIFFAFACYYPEAPVLIWGILPMKTKYLMALLIAMDVLYMRTGDHVSHVTHLAGLAVGYLILTIRHRDPDLRTWRWRE
ncbi:rhomboid family intramembrane serine protease [bacterium]|nr:rhomboid family intramembrane serine protease [bacterium]